jgi:hypothetical protein
VTWNAGRMITKTAARVGVLVLMACTPGEPAAPPRGVVLSKEDPGVEPCRAAAAASPAAAATVRVRDLEPEKVIGVLGQPLGVVLRIDGTIVDGASLADKVHSSSYLLRVEQVAGVRLALPVVMELSSDPALGLPTESFALHEWKTGRKVDSLSDRDIAKLNEGYVGASVSVYAYETGQFGGVPSCLPRGVPVWQDTGFTFHSSLVVLQRLK